MKHYVFYFPNADRTVQELIAQADDPQVVIRAFDRIDRLLARQPCDIGESRFENVRVAFEEPIGLLYEILNDPPTVIVLDVWRIR